MNGLIALRVSSLNCFNNFYILNDTIVDVKKQGFTFNRVEFGNNHLELDFIYYLFG